LCTDAVFVCAQAAAQHRAAVKERKKANQEKSAQVQKVGTCCQGATQSVQASCSDTNGDVCRQQPVRGLVQAWFGYLKLSPETTGAAAYVAVRAIWACCGVSIMTRVCVLPADHKLSHTQENDEEQKTAEDFADSRHNHGQLIALMARALIGGDFVAC
jgi:hypothetical protein